VVIFEGVLILRVFFF